MSRFDDYDKAAKALRQAQRDNDAAINRGSAAEVFFAWQRVMAATAKRDAEADKLNRLGRAGEVSARASSRWPSRSPGQQGQSKEQGAMSDSRQIAEALRAVLNSTVSHDLKRVAVRRAIAQTRGQPSSPGIDAWLSEQARAFGVAG
jgi:hypothetical protein